uniref:Arginine and serine rich coiled-coil 2 n=1 Tax=Suricata suricatta TaxID=37032 RepID=A0A673V0X1_SURSU
MARTDTNAKKESHREAEVTQDPGPVKGVIVVEAESGRSPGPGVGRGRSQDPEAERGRNQDPEAGKENVGSDLDPVQDQDTGTGVEAGVGQGVEVEIERRELKNQEDLAEV